MPKASFQFQITTFKPAAIVFAEPFLKKPLAQFLRSQGLKVKRKLGPVDYLIDVWGLPEAIQLAKKHQAKYLRLLEASSSPPSLEEINWRLVRTDILVGPEMSENHPLARPLIAAVKNELIVMPWPKKTKIFLLHPQDLAQALWQALVLPGTKGREFLVLGQETTAENLAHFLEQLGQTDKGIQFLSQTKPRQFSFQESQATRRQFHWQPNYGWQEAVEEAFQFFWQKLQSGKKTEGPNLEKSREDSQPKPLPELTKEPEEKKGEKREKIIIIEEDRREKSEEAKIQEILSHFQAPQEKSTEQRKSNWLKWGLIMPILLLIFLLAVWLKPIVALGFGIYYLKQGKVALERQLWNEGAASMEKAKAHFWRGEDLLKNSRFSPLFFGLEEDLGKAAEIGRKISQASQTGLVLAQNSLALLEAVLKDRPFDFEKAIPTMFQQEKELIAQLDLIQGLLFSPWPHLPSRWRQKIYQVRETMEKIKLALTKSEKILPHLPWLVAANGQRRTFLVLLQNNMELRPTGGFIGSFALLTFEDGALTNFEVKDVYVADGQLKGHVEPPKQIKEILGEETWYLRDANWNPDFPKTARNVEWFLRKELGREVDGVIGFNLEAAKKLIAALGEVYLPDFNEKINANNLFERAEFWAENKFFPGSTQKMAFLGLLGKQLFEIIKAARPVEYLKIGQAILAGLEEKEILIYVHQPQLAQNLAQLNWDGRIKKPQCNFDHCFSDYLYLVEANLGVNKANYFLRRSLEQSIEFKEEGQIIHQLKIHYENTAVSGNWPGGHYVNWLRVYLPLETRIEEIAIFDSLNSQSKTIISPEQREEEIKDGKEVIGFLVRVPIKQRRTVTLRFSQRAKIEKETFGYLLYWQKQSGYQSTPVSLLISFPAHWQPIQVNPAASLVSGKLLFNQQLDRDLIFGVEFGR